MSRMWTIALVCAVLTVAAYSGSSLLPSGPPRVRVGQPPELATKGETARFLIYNDGGERLILSDADACCGSTPRPQIMLAPGESRIVEIPLGNSNPSKFHYRTNDPMQPLLLLSTVVESGIR